MIDQTTKSTTQSVSSSGQTKLTTLNLVLDPGTSCTKNIYSKGRRGTPVKVSVCTDLAVEEDER